LINRKTGEYKWHVDVKLNIENGRVEIERNKINYAAVRSALQFGAGKVYDYFLNDPDEMSNIPLFNMIERFLTSASKMRSDITSGYIFNLNPNEIKKPEDIARPAEISQNGSGLAATLFFIQERQNKRQNSMFGPHLDDESHNYRVSLKSMKQLFCLINENIIDLRVQNDALENKLVVIAQVKGIENPIEVPLAMLSDGTVKWFSLVTAILSRKMIFSIEEPENFLHPHMQKEIVDILRNNAKDDSEIFSLITTHSESFLNALDPEEIIVTKMESGVTKTSRSEDSEIIRKEINESGFGLGYFYVTGIIQ